MKQRRRPCPSCGYLAPVGASICAGCRSPLLEKPANEPPPPSLSESASPVPASPLSRKQALILSALAGVLLLLGLLTAGLLHLDSSETASSRGLAPPPQFRDTSEGESGHSDGMLSVTAAQTIPVDFRPEDLVFGGVPERLYVGGSNRVLEIDPNSGTVVRTLPAHQRVEALHVIHNRWLVSSFYWGSHAVSIWDLRSGEVEPTKVRVGSNIGNAIGLPDNASMLVSAVNSHQLSRVHLPSATVERERVRFQNTIGSLFSVVRHGRPAIVAMGGVYRGRQGIGEWVGVIDLEGVSANEEVHSLRAGRQPRKPGISRDGTRLLFPDRLSNQATLIDLNQPESAQTVGVGRFPQEAYIMPNDRYGFTVNDSGSLTILRLAPLEFVSTLELPHQPASALGRGRGAASSRALGYAAVALKGSGRPGNGQGVVFLAGSPPEIVTRAPTGQGPSAVAINRAGTLVATANTRDRNLSLLRVSRLPTE